VTITVEVRDVVAVPRPRRPDLSGKAHSRGAGQQPLCREQSGLEELARGEGIEIRYSPE
jgi:hypothetical protein